MKRAVVWLLILLLLLTGCSSETSQVSSDVAAAAAGPAGGGAPGRAGLAPPPAAARAGQGDEEQITFTAVLDDSTDPAVALEYADTMIRQFNLYANIQDGSVSLGNLDSFGGLYDKYSIFIGIAPASKINDQDNWFIFDAIAPGVQPRHTIRLQRPNR